MTVEPRPPSYGISMTAEAKSNSIAMARLQARARKRKTAKPISSQEQQQTMSVHDTEGEFTPDEDVVFPLKDLGNSEHESHSETESSDQARPTRQPQQKPRMKKVSRRVPLQAEDEGNIFMRSDIARRLFDLVRIVPKFVKISLAVLLTVWLLIRLCQWHEPPPVPDYKIFKVMERHGDYGELLQFVGDHQGLSFELLKSADKVSDLQIDVEQSSLPSRKAFGREFSIFDRHINTASDTFRDFLAQVQSSGHALVNADQTMMRQLDSLNQVPSPWTATIKFLNIFSGYNPATRTLSNILDEYLLLLDLSIERIDEVYHITEKTLSNLETLRQDTSRIYAITKKDEKSIKAAKRKEDRKWWKNKGALEELDDQLRLLRDVDKRRDITVEFVTEVRDKVKNMKAALKELKRQAMKPRAQYKHGKVNAETTERNLRDWHTALSHQIVSLEQKLEAIAPGPAVKVIQATISTGR